MQQIFWVRCMLTTLRRNKSLAIVIIISLATMMFLSENAMAVTNVQLAYSGPKILEVSSNSQLAPSTIIVPDDFSSISAAVGNASAGDTILVRSGTYFENPIIDKPLSLLGEDGGKT